MEVVPAATPLTTPSALIDAIEVLPLLQVPPNVASNRLVTAPGQTAVIPVIAGGVAGGVFIVIVLVVKAVPQLLETL